MTTDSTLARTPLYDEHVRQGARMVEFGGWEMPVQYSSIIAEHKAVRTGAGIFDISHMGEFGISGPDALAFIQRTFTNDAAAIAPGHAQYSLICKPDGGVVDDTFIYHLPDSTPENPAYLVIVNAANIKKDYDWLAGQIKPGERVDLVDQSAVTGLLAVQGPQAEAILQPLVQSDLSTMQRNTCRYDIIAGVRVLIARTGYTGEDGLELAMPSDQVVKVWRAILDAGQNGYPVPAGLGARDTLRLESKYALYGHEIDETTNPIEAGLGWAVKLDKGDFHGRDAIAAAKEHGTGRKLVGFVMQDRGIARAGYPIQHNGQQVGYVTSGSPSPTLNQNIGLGYVPTELAKVGNEIEIVVRNQPMRAKIVRTPFYKRSEKS